jgi:hypothetical protein
MKNVSLLLAFLLFHFAAFGQNPESSFTGKTRVCSNTEFAIHSTSTDADTYEWLVDDIHYSYAPDTVLSLFSICNDYINLKLIATNTSSGLSDTSGKIVFVTGVSCSLHLYVDYEGCPGDTVTYASHPDAVHSQWTFDEPQTIVGGCDTCSFISFVLITPHPTVVNTQTYDGGCSDIIEYTAYFCPENTDVKNTHTNNEVTIAPNPMKDKSVLHFNNAQQSKYQLNLYNMEGRLVNKTENITGSEITIERKDLPAGIYFYQLMSEDGKGMRGKIVME